MLQAWWLDNVNLAKPASWLQAWQSKELNAACIWKILSLWCNHLADKLWYTDLNYSAGLNTWDLVELEATAWARSAPEEQRTQLCLAHRRGPASVCQYEFIIECVDRRGWRRAAFGLLCVHRHSCSGVNANRWGSRWQKARIVDVVSEHFWECSICVSSKACACLGVLRNPCLLLRKQKHLLFVF